MVLWDAARRTRLVAEPLPVAEGDVWSVAFSPDGKTLAAGYAPAARGVVLWDAERRSRLAAEPLPVAEGGVRSVAFSPDGKTLAAGARRRRRGALGRGAAARLAAEPLPVPEGAVASVAFSPDGKTLAAAYGVVGASRIGGGVVLWDAERRTPAGRPPLPVAEGGVQSVAFSPDGKTLAAGYASSARPRGVVLWDAARRTRLADPPLPVAEGGVQSVAFSPDGKTLAAACGDGVVLWDVDLESWIRYARQIANRNMTRAEWQQYFPDTPYRPTFDNLPVPPGADPGDAHVSAVRAGDVPKGNLE